MFIKPKSQQILRGVDVSAYQNEIDWTQVKANGISFAFIKATEGGDFVDATFSDNWKNAHAAGVTCGAYHFFRPKTDVATQVDNFLKTLATPQEGDLPPVLDLEVPEDWTNIPQGNRMGLILSWLTKVKAALGVTPIVYLDPDFVVSVLGGDASQLKGYQLWIANYGVSFPDVPSAWKTWTFWQYSENGTVKGISDATDLDQYNGSALRFSMMRTSRIAAVSIWRKILGFVLDLFGL